MKSCWCFREACGCNVFRWTFPNGRQGSFSQPCLWWSKHDDDDDSEKYNIVAFFVIDAMLL